MKPYSTAPILLLLMFGATRSVAQLPAKANTAPFNTSALAGGADPGQFGDVSLSGYELFTAAFKLSSDDNLVKVSLMPWKLSSANTSALLQSVKITAANTKDALTPGLGLGFDNSSPLSKRGKDLYNQVAARLAALPPLPMDVTPEQKFNYEARQDSILKDYYELLTEHSMQFTLGANLALFTTLGGDEVDADKDSLVDNFHSVQGITLSGNLVRNFSRDVAASASAYWSNKYTGPGEAYKKTVPTVGGTITLAVRVWKFDKNYRQAKDYLKSLFIAGLSAGVSADYAQALDNEEYAKDAVKTTRTIMPFIDIKVSQASQFRIGIPLKTYSRRETKDLDQLSTFFQYSLQLVDLNK